MGYNMNYEKIHNDLINYCLCTDLKSRIYSRNPRDARLNSENIYTEKPSYNPKAFKWYKRI